uniref:Uncharacterized protein n=1 Tax=Moniliophthora roreri TaxID=221103 RepID=A0A0W0FBT6_MONRR
MTQLEEKLETIKDWMNAAILYEESWKQVIEHRIKNCPEGKKNEPKKEEPKKELKVMTREERFTKIQAIIDDQTKEEKDLLLNLMEKEGF